VGTATAEGDASQNCAAAPLRRLPYGFSRKI